MLSYNPHVATVAFDARECESHGYYGINALML